VTSTIPTKPTSASVVEAYAAAWNAHDGAAVAALVGGSYVDPTLPEPLSGDAIAAMVDGLCAAFPDLRFETLGTYVDGRTTTFHWRMQGTNDGTALPGAPAPTGGTIDLPGVDIITTDGDRIVDVVGFFDQKTFVEQLGLQTFVMPSDSWPVAFGTATRIDLGNVTQPGALTMTWIDVDPGEQAELIQRSTDIVTALASDPGFIGFQATTVGTRNTTLAVWTSPAAAEAAIARATPHEEARQRMNSGYGRRGYTSFWQPYRLNAQFARCECGGEVEMAGGPSGTCTCGAVVEAQPYL
jgi:heme-degrading monooxygenase HmoA